jgi:hypothetical protein
MESSMPFALRVAAGLLSEAVGRARRLPADLTTLPVTVIGQVAKFSFELNQQLAELATEGDRLLAGRRSDDAPPQRTAWSTIDDEDEVAARDPQAAATWAAAGSATVPDPAFETTTAPAADVSPAPVFDDDPAPAPAPRAVPGPDAPVGAAAEPVRTPSVRRPGGAGRRVGSGGDSAGARVGGTADGSGSDADATPMDRALIDDVEELEVQRPAPPATSPSAREDGAAADVPPVDVSAMTLAQLRAKVRSWGAAEVRAALEQEQRGKARPAFLTVLTNRLSTLARGGA